jgi:hypothetical protein
MKKKSLIIICIFIIISSGCIGNNGYHPGTTISTEYEVYDVVLETKSESFLEKHEIFYTIYYIDGSDVKIISGSSDDKDNLLKYKISENDKYKLIKVKKKSHYDTMSGIYYFDEWDVYLPKDERKE